ncbi:amino acid carrier protein [Rippkaea orientalis PCC 8801]|uniref:Amino acid carrier protein n=1 Tax=Rippkaea orientalis (strain PCC 8801 / RF-1) TaxID=41431 RepID=B7K5N1_RIPO1|nr:alanine/glycine:cation symporter family protein [Rippkaea orientalis]ACK66764.1 amino acid carrier protein [Rippkaea orientalis PCC 8801]
MSLNSLLDRLDQLFSHLVTILEQILLFDLGGFPLIILWLLFAGLFLTLRMRLINLFGFKHALKIALGQYSNPQDESKGEVTPFQALATALSASIGLGNIAGVAMAIAMGGPGSVFWMSAYAVLGMASKFVSCTLGVKYRQFLPDGTVVGGPMYYLRDGLDKLGQGKLGKILSIIYGLTGIGAAMGGGNMFQANQSFAALATVIPAVKPYDWVFGLILAALVGLVIIGGISRISIVTSRLVPVMVFLYVLGSLWVLAVNFTAIPGAFSLMVQDAFSPQAMEGGIIGVLVQGVRRSAFSNGAGLGVAAIAHSVAKTQEPIQEGIVSMLEPFIDTVVVCNLTALVIITTGTYQQAIGNHLSGSALAATAFGSVISWFPFVLLGIICLFAFSTMITWCYYGEICWAYVLGEPSRIIFKILFLVCIFIGSVVNLGAVINFSDMMLLLLTIPNLLGCIFLSAQVADDLDKYFQRLI